MMDAAFLEQYKKNFPNGPIRYTNLAKIQPEIIEERHIRLRLRVEGDDLHTNHVGTVYAGSMFVMAEHAGADLFSVTYGRDEFLLVIKAVDMHYLKPSTHDLIVELSLTQEEAAKKIASVRERGRGDYFLDISLYDTEGVKVFEGTFNYYCIPASMDFSKQ